MFEVVRHPGPDGVFTGKVFGESFTFSSDVNSWLLALAGAGGSREIVALVRSILRGPNGESDVEAVEAEFRRFNEIVGAQPNMPFERVAELINALTEVSAGNAR